MSWEKHSENVDSLASISLLAFVLHHAVIVVASFRLTEETLRGEKNFANSVCYIEIAARRSDNDAQCEMKCWSLFFLPRTWLSSGIAESLKLHCLLIVVCAVSSWSHIVQGCAWTTSPHGILLRFSLPLLRRSWIAYFAAYCSYSSHALHSFFGRSSSQKVLWWFRSRQQLFGIVSKISTSLARVHISSRYLIIAKGNIFQFIATFGFYQNYQNYRIIYYQNHRSLYAFRVMLSLFFERNHKFV